MEPYEELMPGIKLEKTGAAGGVILDPQLPEFRQWVYFEWTGYSGATIFSPPNKSWVKIGDGDVCPGMELGLRSLRKNETGVVTCEPRFAFGATGRPKVAEGDTELPPDSSVKFHLHLLKLGESPETSAAGQLEEGQRKRSLGNGHFQYRDYEKAARCYGAGLKAIDGLLELTDDQEAAAHILNLMIDSGNNLAACYLKLALFQKAEDACIAVLSASPDNPKALYRAGISAMHQTKFKESRLALEKLFSLDSENAAAKKQLRELAKRESRYRGAEKALYKNMSKILFSDSSSSRSATEPNVPPASIEATPMLPEKATEMEPSLLGYTVDRKWALLGIAVMICAGAALVATTEHAPSEL